MNILLLTGHTCYLNNYTAFTVPVMQAYCRKHGYDFVCETNMEEWNMGRQYPWAKLLFIKKWLQTKQYDIVIWVDADVLIMDQNMTWQEILASQPEGDVYICEETISNDIVPRKNVNTGVMAFRNTGFSERLLDLMWNAPNLIESYRWSDQSRLIEILRRKELPDTDRTKLVLCPQRLFNSMLINGSYDEGDFLIHFAGYEEVFPGKQRINIIREYVQKMVPEIEGLNFPPPEAYFSQAVVINLDRREDRWKQFTEEAGKAGISCQRVSALDAKAVSVPEYVLHVKKGIIFTPGAWALAKTTQSIIREAIDKNHESILIMEDDIAFTGNCKEYLFNAMLELPDDWEVLFLTQYPFRNPQEAGLRYWQKPRLSYSCAMYVVRKSVFREYYQFLQRPEIPIDNFLAEQIQPRGKCYGLRQSIAWQVSGASDIDPTSAKKWNVNENNHNILVRK